MRLNLILVAFACAGMAAFAEDFSATQLRFYPAATNSVDVELSRYGTYTALADWVSAKGNFVSVLDANWELLWRHPQQGQWSFDQRQSMVQFGPDESYLVIPAYRTENDIALVNPKTGEPLSVLTDHTEQVQCLGLSPDGSRMASSTYHEVFLWQRDGKGFKVVDRLTDYEPAVSSIVFSPDGSAIATIEDDTQTQVRRIVIYDVSGNRLAAIGKFENQETNLSSGYTQVAFSPDGQWLAAGYGGTPTLTIFHRDGKTFGISQTVPSIELGSVKSVAFSPDGALLFTGHRQDIREWRLERGTWQAEATFTPHEGAIRDMKFSIDGTELAVAGWKDEANALGLWAVKGVGSSPSGTLLALLQGRVSAAQKRFLDDALAGQILSGLVPADTAPRDMFETEEEYAARLGRARTQAAGSLQEETERHFSAERSALSDAMYEVSVPLQTQGSYAVDSRVYTFRFMDTDVAVKLERDVAKELYQNWQKARVRAVRLETAEGKTYADFRLALPISGLQFPLGLSENPFTGEKLDRYGAHVPSVTVGPDLLMRNLDIQGVFPAIYRYYAEHSIGRMTLQNTGTDTITGLSVRFLVPGLMKAPTDAQVSPNLGVGQSSDVEIRAILDSSVLDRSEGILVPAEVAVEYSSGGKAYKEAVSRPIEILNRNALRWTDDRKVGAFMVIDDPAFLQFSGQVMGMMQDDPTAVLTRSFLSAVQLFAALKAAELHYVVDPSSPYETLSRDSSAIDFVRFPSETLKSKSGDCSDLSVLYDSLLESIHVDTAYITVPGHIFTAFNLGMSPDTASRSFPSPEDLIIKDDAVWIPVETTLVEEGFMKAWRTAAVEWRDGKAKGVAGFFTTKEAWRLYAPSGFAGAPPSAIPARERVAESFNADLDEFRAAALGPREKDLLDQLEKAPSPAAENRLGLLYAQFGLLAKALERFEDAISKSAYVPSMVNAANVCGILRKYDRAQDYLRRALQLEPENARVLLALAHTLFQSGEESDARAAFERASKIDLALSSRYPLPGEAAPPAGQTRAAQEGKASELFSTDWVE
jgi:WD40 repeat protein